MRDHKYLIELIVRLQNGEDCFCEILGYIEESYISAIAHRWSLHYSVGKFYEQNDIMNIMRYRAYTCALNYVFDEAIAHDDYEASARRFYAMLKISLNNQGSDLRYRQEASSRKPPGEIVPVGNPTYNDRNSANEVDVPDKCREISPDVVRSFVRKLNSRERFVVKSLTEGLRDYQIANALGMSIATVRMSMQKAQETLNDARRNL